MILHEWIAFYSTFLNIHRSGVLTALAWLVPQESAARVSLGAFCVHHTTMHCVTSCKATFVKVYACLAVTCHLRFWQNDRAGSFMCYCSNPGVDGYRNKSQHKKLTLEKKIIPLLQQGFEPVTFRSRVRRSNHWAIPAPPVCVWRSCITDQHLNFGLDFPHSVTSTDEEPTRKHLIFRAIILLLSKNT